MSYFYDSCGKCGAPYSLPSVWHGIIPPTPQPSCNCWNLPTPIIKGPNTNATELLYSSDNDSPIRNNTLNKIALKTICLNLEAIIKMPDKEIKENIKELIKNINFML